MTVKFLNTTTGQELTAGQALDVWLRYTKKLYSTVSEDYSAHLFADAMGGYSGAWRAVEKAGIEIKFGDANEQQA